MLLPPPPAAPNSRPPNRPRRRPELRHAIAAPLLATAIATLLAACGGGESAAPPTNVGAVAGDGRATITWSGEPGVEYWVFGAADAALSSSNWTGLAGAFVEMNANQPFTACGLVNATPYYFALNGRRDGGPGGQHSPLVSATPRAAGETWTANATLGGDGFNAVGQRGALTCSTVASTRVDYVAVGDNGALTTSANGQTWATPSAKPADFTSALRAVAATGGAGARWVAVGDNGATLISGDGATWTRGATPAAGAGSLRGIASNGLKFVAVGDGGTMLESTDGSAWSTLTLSGFSENLRAIAYSSRGYFIAVGDNGSVVMISDGAITGASNVGGVSARLTSVAAGAYIETTTNTDGGKTSSTQYGVLIGGAGGVALYSTFDSENKLNFATVPLASSDTPPPADFVAATHHSRFLLLDNDGKAWATTDGKALGGPFTSGLAAPAGLVGADGRYIAVGAAGASATSF